MRHADDAGRRRALAALRIDQRNTNGVRAQRADLPQQGGGSQVRQHRGNDDGVKRRQRGCFDRRIAIGYLLRLPLIAQVGDIGDKVGRKTGFVPNKQNTQDTSPEVTGDRHRPNAFGNVPNLPTAVTGITPKA